MCKQRTRDRRCLSLLSAVSRVPRKVLVRDNEGLGIQP